MKEYREINSISPLHYPVLNSLKSHHNLKMKLSHLQVINRIPKTLLEEHFKNFQAASNTHIIHILHSTFHIKVTSKHVPIL